jgi:hypothetical protein
MTFTGVGFGNDLINEREWALLNHLGDLGVSGQAVSAITGDRTVSVAVGQAAIKGILCEVTAAHSLQAAANSSGQTRIDRVIWSLNWSTNTATLTIKQGTPSGSPQPPALTQTVATLWEESLARLTVANGQGAFAAGDVLSTIPTVRPVETIQTLDSITTSTTFIFGANACGRTFVAPASGQVLVSIYHEAENNTEGAACLSSFEIREGIAQGGVLVGGAASENDRIQGRSFANVAVTVSSIPMLRTGLTPGTTYTAWHKHRIGSGTGTFNVRRIIVQPVL